MSYVLSLLLSLFGATPSDPPAQHTNPTATAAAHSPTPAPSSRDLFLGISNGF